MAAHYIPAAIPSIPEQSGTTRFPTPALPRLAPSYNKQKQFFKDSQCRRSAVAAFARRSLSTIESQARDPDRILPPVEYEDDRLGTSASGAVIIAALVGSLCLSTPALANFQSYDHADMRGANLSDQNLAGAVFAACDCRKINMSGSNLDGTTDTFAGFQGANLRNTSWIRAFADRVVFREANLQNANFTDAILSGSQFDGADITGADFTDALVDNYQRLKMCKTAEGTNPVTGIETKESLFCK